jgi:hypothetical protein
LAEAAVVEAAVEANAVIYGTVLQVLEAVGLDLGMAVWAIPAQ